MCGRFALGIPHDEIEQMHGYNVHVGEWVGRNQFVPRYNVAPRSQAPVIRRLDAGSSSGSGNHTDQGGPSSTPPGPADAKGSKDATPPSVRMGTESSTGPPLAVEMQTMRWGLVPHFSKHEDGSLKTINARSEVLIEEARGMWASIKGRKRCAVVCQGYYEWLKKGKERLPHFTKPADGRLMLLAGLWDSVVLEGSSETLWTFTIVTTEASKEMSWLHDRQPVILPDEHALSLWLDTSAGKWTPELSELCAPYHAAEHPLTCYQVPKEVGKIGTESPTFVQPIAGRKDGIQAMFASQARRRKRSPSPPPDVSSTTADDGPKKKARVDADAWEDDDSDIECIDDPRSATHDTERTPKTPTRGSAKPADEASSAHHPIATHPPSSPSSRPPKAAEKPSKPSPRKSKAPQRSDSSAKITSFFAKR